MSNNDPTINLKEGHPDFKVDPGLNNVIRWHGTNYDLRRISRSTAEAMAKEPATSYVNYSDERIARDARAQLEVFNTSKPAATAPAVTEESTEKAAETATAGTADETDAATASTGTSGRRNRRRSGSDTDEGAGE
jgi:hypothetical protein